MKIVFAHNVYNRFQTLKNTISAERNHFPDSKIAVAHNDTFKNIFTEFNDIQFIEFGEKPHKIGCVNGCILSIQQLMNTDFDVLIFSHDDVSIININVVNKHIEDIISGKYDVICRKPLSYNGLTEIFGGYYMMETVYFSKNAVLKLFTDIKTLKDENEIPTPISGGSISPEVWFYKLINNKELKINEIRFDIHANYNDNLSQQMGYFHKNIGLRGWND